jgi:hypothetical protein
MIAIKINGVEYTNISSCSPDPVYDFYYNVQTMDGKIHRDIKGKRTNYTVVFYNKDYQEYDNLKKLLFSAKSVILEVPNGAESTTSGEYLVVVNGDNLKGELWSGKYYNTGLSVTFEKVGYDE